MTTETADAVVVGGGVVGASITFHLARLGIKRSVLCERKQLAAGASGRSGALVRMHYTNEPEARLAAASLPYFQNWAEVVGHGRCGFLSVGVIRLVCPQDGERLKANVEMLRRLGINTRLVERAELQELAPEWWFEDVEFAAYEPDSGCADPVATTEWFARAAAALGARVMTGTEVVEVMVEGGRVKGVVTGRGTIFTRTVLVAGGAWALPLLARLGLRLPVRAVRVQAVAIRRPAGLAGPHPVCIDGPNRVWFRPDGSNLEVTVGAVRSYREPVSDPEAFPETADPEFLELTRQRIARRFPAVGFARVQGGWAGVVTTSPDGKPVIDRHPEVEGLYFFTADNGTSFKTAPAIGRALAEWAALGRPQYVDISPFRASRFAEGRPLVGEHEYTGEEGPGRQVPNSGLWT